MAKYKKSIETRDRILKTAEELFAQKGYDATGIAEIADKSQITKSLLYYYFDSKEQILQELFSNYLLTVKLEKEKILSSGLSESEKIRQSMLKGFSLLKDNKKIIRILLAEMLKGNVNKEPLCSIIESVIPNSITDLESQGEQNTRSDDFAVYTFFFGLAPVITCMMFGDVWIKNNQVDEDTFAEQFISMAIASFSNDITGVTKDFFEPQKDLMIENIKKLLDQ